MPNKFFSPQPPRLPHGDDKLDDVRMPLTRNDPFLDVEYKRAILFQYAIELIAYRQEPVYVLVRFDTTIGVGAAIGIWRGGHDKINGGGW